MTLAITNGHYDPMLCVRLSPTDLNTNPAHAVIASKVWDECYIDVDEAIEESKLRMLSTKCRKIFARFPEHPSRHQMVLLTELYPDLAGSIRKAFLKGDDLHGVLPYLWREGSDPGREDMHLST